MARYLSVDVFDRFADGWFAMIRGIYRSELQREPTDNELKTHMVWIMAQKDGVWNDEKVRAYVRTLDEWTALHGRPEPAAPHSPGIED